MIPIKKLCVLVIYFISMFSFLRNNVICGNSCFKSQKTSRPDEQTYRRCASHRDTPNSHQLPKPEPFIPLSLPMFRSFSSPRQRRNLAMTATRSQSFGSSPSQSFSSRPVTVPDFRAQRRTETRDLLRPAAESQPRPLAHINGPTNVRRVAGLIPVPTIRFNRPTNLQPVRTTHRRRKSSPVISPHLTERLPSIKEQE